MKKLALSTLPALVLVCSALPAAHAGLTPFQTVNEPGQAFTDVIASRAQNALVLMQAHADPIYQSLQSARRTVFHCPAPGPTAPGRSFDQSFDQGFDQGFEWSNRVWFLGRTQFVAERFAPPQNPPVGPEEESLLFNAADGSCRSLGSASRIIASADAKKIFLVNAPARSWGAPQSYALQIGMVTAETGSATGSKAGVQTVVDFPFVPTGAFEWSEMDFVFWIDSGTLDHAPGYFVTSTRAMTGGHEKVLFFPAGQPSVPVEVATLPESDPSHLERRPASGAFTQDPVSGELFFHTGLVPGFTMSASIESLSIQSFGGEDQFGDRPAPLLEGGMARLDLSTRQWRSLAYGMVNDARTRYLSVGLASSDVSLFDAADDKLIGKGQLPGAPDSYAVQGLSTDDFAGDLSRVVYLAPVSSDDPAEGKCVVDAHVVRFDLLTGTSVLLGTRSYCRASDKFVRAPDQRAWAVRPDLGRSWTLRQDELAQVMVLVEQDWDTQQSAPVAIVPASLGAATPQRIWVSADARTYSFLDGNGQLWQARRPDAR